MQNSIKTLFFFLLIFLSNPCFAQEKPRHLQAVEYLTGFGGGNLDKKGKYEHIPFLVDFDFNFKERPQGKDIKPQLFQFVLEPFISCVLQPDANVEIGGNFLFKLNIFPESEKLRPYIKAGTGLIYLSQKNMEQSSPFNFNEIGGFGLHYFFKEDRALTLELRYRHISNANLGDPNRGIDSTFGICGISYRF